MSQEKQNIIKYGDTFLEHYNSELGELYKKFSGDLFHHTIRVNPEDLLGVRSVNLSKKGLMVLSCTNSPAVKSFDFQNGEIPFTYNGHARTVRMVSFHNKNEDLLITGSWDGTIHVLDLVKLKRLRVYSGMGRIPCVYMHDNYLYTGSYDRDLNSGLNNRGRIIDYRTGQILYYFNHGASIDNNECIDMIFIPSDIIISGSDDGRIFKWRIDHDSQDPELLGEFKPFIGCIRKITLSPDLKSLAIGSGDKSIRIYDVESLTMLKEFSQSHTEDVTDIKFSADQKFLYSCSFDKQIKKWDIATGNEIFTSSGHNNWVWKLCLFRDILISCSSDGNICFYDEYGKLQCTYHNLKDVSSFLFTSPPDPLNPGGSFFTNNPELIQVTRIENNLPVIASADEKNNYFKKHNNKLILQKVLNNKSVEKIINSIQHKKETNLLRFIFPPSQQLGEGSDIQP